MLSKREFNKVSMLKSHERFKVRDKRGRARYCSLPELTSELRHRYLVELKAKYWHHFEEGKMMPESLLILTEAVNRSLDVSDKPLSDWDYVKGVYENDIRFKILTKIINWPCIGYLMKKAFYTRVLLAYDCLVNFYDCHEEAAILFR